MFFDLHQILDDGTKGLYAGFMEFQMDNSQQCPPMIPEASLISTIH
jgi:hypothetical protein